FRTPSPTARLGPPLRRPHAKGHRTMVHHSPRRFGDRNGRLFRVRGYVARDAYVNAAMILAGMGPMGELKTTAGKIFAGSYAIFSGLLLIIATGFVLAPIFHRILHHFHVETHEQD